MIGEKKAKMPMLMEQDKFVQRALVRNDPQGDAKILAATHDAEDAWNVANDSIHNVLSVSLRNCAAARTILGKYVAGLPVAAGKEPSIYADGKAAWKELRETAMGGQGIETAEGYLQELYRLPDVVNDVENLLIEHDSLVQKIGQIPDMTLEKVFKMHLLRCLKPFPECDIVEHSCATDQAKGYEDTVREVKSRLNRLKAGSSETGAAFYGADSDSQIECWNCGQKGHRRADCRVNTGNQTKGRGKGSKGGGKGNSTTAGKPGKGKSKGAAVRKKLREAEAKLAEATESKKEAEEGFGFSCEQVDKSGDWLTGMLTWLFQTLVMCIGFETDTFESESWIVTLMTVVFACSGCLMCQGLWNLLYSKRDQIAYAAGIDGSMFDFVIDSGASRHVVGAKTGLTGWKPYNARLKIADGSYLEVTGIGDLNVIANGQRIRMKGVWFAPKLETPLFSVRWHRRQDGCGVSFEDDLFVKIGKVKVPFQEAPNGSFTLHASVDNSKQGVAMNGLAIVRRSPVAVDNARLRAKVDLSTWHERLGHLSKKNIKLLVDKHIVEGIKIATHKGEVPETHCPTCVMANLKTKPRAKLDGIRSTKPLELVHVDGVEGFSVESFGRRRGYLFTDDYSRAKFFYGVTKKSDFLAVLQEFTAQMKQRSHSVKTVLIGCIQSDFAAELSAGKTSAWCAANGVKLQHSAPGSHKEAGIAEKAIDIVKSRARALHRGAGFPTNFWLLSMIAACHILLFVPNTVFDGQCSYFRLFGVVPDVSHLRTIGCLVFFYNWYSGKQNFITDRGLTGVLVGYCHKSRSYLIWRPDTKRVVRSAEVVFDEGTMPMVKPDPSKTDPSSMRVAWGQTDDDELHRIEFGNRDSGSDSEDAPAPAPDPRGEEDAPAEEVVLDSPSRGGRPQRASAQDARAKIMQDYWTGAANSALSNEEQSEALEQLCCVALGDSTELGTATSEIQDQAGFYCDQGFEPASYKEAMACSDHDLWQAAMEKEMDGLERLGTFCLVDKNEVHAGVKIIKSRWVYKIKPDKYKARFVVKGFLQAAKDVGETFSPTVKMITLRLIFALAAVLSWTCRQMDVCNAFVNADTPRGVPVYMECPQGFEHDAKVMKLLKALYGLKGSPRAWWQHLTLFLKKLGFVVSALDACAFVLVVNGITEMIVGVYVDDLLIAGQVAAVTWFCLEIKKSFLMQDLGQPSKIVGINVEFKDDAILVHQEDYAKKVLDRFKFEDSTEKRTPMEVRLKLTADETEDSAECESFPYRSLVACMLYLSVCTRFDLCYTIKELSRWLIKPGTAMIKAAKRALRYVKGSTRFGLVYKRVWRPDRMAGYFTNWSRDTPVAGTVDADWAGQQDTRKSTAGFMLLFNGALIHWWSRTLKVIALSSQDAEYMALSDSSRELIFIRQLLESLGFEVTGPTELYSDNMGALALANKPCDHHKSKHIQVRYHFVRQQVEEKVIVTLKVGTELQLADVMTKALSSDRHWALCIRAAGMD
jgi:hypothetical protein